MTRNRVRNSVKASLQDGLAWAGMTGFVEPYVVPFALALGASNPAIGFLRAAPPLAASLAQLLNEKMVRSLGSCRTAMRLDVLVQSVSLFLAAASVFCPAGAGFWCLCVAMILYTVAGNMAGPPWATLMGEYIPYRKRGTFFGFRNQLVGVTFFLTSLLAAKLLNLSPVLPVFAGLFTAGGLFRLLSFHYIGRMYEPPGGRHLPAPETAGQAKPPNPALRSFLFSIFALMFSSFLVAPYFSVYLLKELHWGYMQYMIVISSGQLVTYLVMRRWGRLADAFGSVRILKISFVCIPVIPLLWAFSPSFPWLVAAELFSGVIWAAYGISTNNFIYELGGASSRTKYNALFGFTACLGQFAGALVGGFLYEALPGNAFHGMLFISAALRLLAVAPFVTIVSAGALPAGDKPDFLLSAIGFRSIDIYPAAPPRPAPGK